MKSFIFTTILLALLCANANSQTISEAEANDIALSFLSQSKHAPGRDTAPNALTLAHKAAQGDETYYYVFNYGSDSDQGGFVIVGGDERAEAILGYSDNGQLDWESAPDNFKWWMSQYESEIHAAIEQGLAPRQARHRAQAVTTERADIPDMIKTKWSQSAPYYNEIPKPYTGTDRFVTGCVATAMAQVMYYHRCPAEYGTGEKSYTAYVGYTGYNFYANFGATKYDWDNMKLEYKDNNYTDAEAAAIAKLMYHAGVSVKMQYNTASNGGSGANSENIPTALSTYFGYDKSAEFVQRQYYDDEEWFDIIYSELAAGRPVLYGGYNAHGSGGHQFVCHGYDAENQKFAINWGWNGAYDGYFTMVGTDGLQPEGNGTGGAGNGASYTTSQDAIIHVMPDAGGQAPLEICNWESRTPIFKDQNGTKTSKANYDISTETKEMTYTLQPANYGLTDRDYELSIKLKNTETGQYSYASDSYSGTLESLNYATVTLKIKATDFTQDGTYAVIPMIRAKGTEEWKKYLILSGQTAPVIQVTGAQEEEELKEVAFSISGDSVVVYSNLFISHDEFYDGAIEYSSSDPSLVSVDANGAVTGNSPGTATITAKALGNKYYKETIAQFQVTATPYTKLPVELAISKTDITVGKTCKISCITTGFTGSIAYTSYNQNVATVSEDGTITGIAAGTATIAAVVYGNKFYASSVQTFVVTVNDPEFVLLGYTMGENGYFTEDNFKITTTIKNNTGERKELTLYFYFSTLYKEKKFSTTYLYSAGETMTKKYNFTSVLKSDFPAGTQGTLKITDEDGCVFLERSFEVCNLLTITHTVPEEGWSTICLPFEAAIPTGLNVYSISDELEDEALKLVPAEKIEKNTPYIVKGNAGTYTLSGPNSQSGTSWTNGALIGNTQSAAEGQLYAPINSYVLMTKNGAFGFFRVRRSNYQQIDPYSAYIYFNDEQTGYSCLMFEEDECGITAIYEDTDEEDDSITVNLQGQRVQQGQKGFVVKNGKVSLYR